MTSCLDSFRSCVESEEDAHYPEFVPQALKLKNAYICVILTSTFIVELI